MSASYDGSKGRMVTFTRRVIDLTNLSEHDIDIRDIAHALSHVNRFGGHCDFPINVALHSVWCSYLLEGTGWELDALLHDASEAYVGDLTRWVKRLPMMQPYRELEEDLQMKINRKFGCRMIDGMPEAVRGADDLMVRWEALQGYSDVDDFFGGHPNYPPIQASERKLLASWTPASPEISERWFLDRFETVRRLARAI